VKKLLSSTSNSSNIYQSDSHKFFPSEKTVIVDQHYLILSNLSKQVLKYS